MKRWGANGSCLLPSGKAYTLYPYFLEISNPASSLPAAYLPTSLQHYVGEIGSVYDTLLHIEFTFLVFDRANLYILLCRIQIEFAVYQISLRNQELW